MLEQLLSKNSINQTPADQTEPSQSSASEAIRVGSLSVSSSMDETLDPTQTISLIVLNYNGFEHTKMCLLSLNELDYPADLFEIIVVDNGSTDGSAGRLKSEFPDVRLIENETNLGFSRAANQGATAAKGEYLAFFNNDMRVEKGWLKAMLPVLRPEAGIVCAGSTILNWDGSAVDFIGRPNDAFCLRYDLSDPPPPPAALPLPDEHVLFVSGGALLIQTSVFRELGGFDPDFFLYQEDVDLGWRLWLKGYQAVVSSRSLVYHKSGASSSKLPAEFVYQLNRKHALFSVFKNLETENLRELLPILLYFFVERIQSRPNGREAVATAFHEFESAIELLIEKRQEVQQTRVKRDAEIFSFPSHPLNFLRQQPYYESFRNWGSEYDFDPADAQSVRTALAHWINRAHFEYERFLLEQMQAKLRQTESLVDQVSERQGAVELLTAQLAERHQRVLVLTEQVAERQRAVNLPMAELERNKQALAALTAQVSEQQQTIQLLSAQIEETQRTQTQSSSLSEDTSAALAADKLAAAEGSAQQLAAQLAATENKYNAQLVRKDNAIRVISAQLEMRQSELEKIKNNPGWRLLSRYGRVKYKYLLPVYRLLRLQSGPNSTADVDNAATLAGSDFSVPQENPMLVRQPESNETEATFKSAPGGPLESSSLETRPKGFGRTAEAVPLTKDEVLARASDDWLPIKLRAAQELIRLLMVNSGVRGVVVFPQTIGWDINLFQRPQQIAISLARQNYLVFYHNADELNGRAEFQRIADRLYLCYAPFEVFGFLEAPIVFALHYNRELLRHLTKPRVVYEMIDELEVFGENPERLERNHLTLLERADLVCVTADRLMEKVRPLRPEALLVPNGVDYDHFEPARNRSNQEIPIPLRTLVAEGKPIIGYYGAHARWVDYELLRYAAQQRPDLNFLLIGPDHEETLRASRLTAIPNVRWLGPRPYQDLPDYLRYFDVAIIPFVVDNITLSVSPLKLFEYLAAGKPVVTTDLPECRKYPQVLVAADREEFVSHLDRALKMTNDMTYRIIAMQTAQKNTWDERVKTILHGLDAAESKSNNSDFALADAEASELIALLTEQLDEQNKTVTALTGQVAEKEENARTMIQAWAGIESEKNRVAKERDQIARERNQLARELEVVSTQLTTVTSSRGWRALTKYGQIKHRYVMPIFRIVGQTPAVEATGTSSTKPESVIEAVRTKIEEAETVEAVPQTTSPYDVIMFPIIDWGFRFQRPQQLASQFAEDGHRVFYLRTTFHQGGVAANAVEIARRIFDVQVPGPTHVSIYRDEINKRLLNELMNAIDLFRRVNVIEEAVCIVQLPFWSPLALAAQQRWGWKVVYDCMDEHSGFPTNNATMLQHEESLVAQSDLVVSSSRKLYDKLSPASKRSLIVPNATDFEHFNEVPPLRPLAKLTGPIIGYYGAISDWFDVEMVLHAAKARPDWQFVLVGDTFGADVSALKRLANVHLPGEQPYAAIPSYLHQFDVAIIPFLLTPLTESTNPVKFYEYLSAGKPVVSVELRELEPYKGYFYPVRSKDEFVGQIEKALREDGPEKIQARMELGRQNTWLDRYQALSAAIRELYGKAAIIIVSFKNREYLWLCLEHLWARTLYANFEVIVVDNGGDPEIVKYLQESAAKNPQLKVILNSENVGFARANNIGIEAAGDCEYVVLLNDDTIVTRYWLARLLRYLHDKPVGLIGPVTNNIGNEGKVEVDYRIVDYQDVDVMEEFAQRRAREFAGRSFDIPMLAMYCVAMRKALLD
ncbi:MAG TPA: glycosyltransferase, partial [Pyrinomonadaceae bacterium]|nr:glycosyltransferase [Pyrinomonadaceae bacterium]